MPRLPPNQEARKFREWKFARLSRLASEANGIFSTPLAQEQARRRFRDFQKLTTAQKWELFRAQNPGVAGEKEPSPEHSEAR